MQEQWTPDCFDINDWLMLAMPELHESIKYLQPSAAYAVGLQAWRNAGMPDIDAYLSSVNP